MKIGLLMHTLVKEELARLGLEKEIRLAVEAVILDEVKDGIRRLAPVILQEMIGRALEGSGAIIEKHELVNEEKSKAVAGKPLYQPVFMAARAVVENEENEVVVNSEAPKKDSPTGRYIYGITEGETPLSLGEIGLEGSEVYTIPHDGLAALVHDCKPEPYQSDDEEVVKGWLAAHQNVLEEAAEEFQNVIPAGFDTIIYDDKGGEPVEAVKKWLAGESTRLKEIMDKIRCRQEYGVQVFWEPEVTGNKLVEDDPGLKEMREKIRSASEGSAYLIRQKLDRALSGAIEKEADRCFRTFFSLISQQCSDVRVEKVKKPEGARHMLMNLSCLLEQDRVPALGEALDEIERQGGFTVRFTGPWPPYSFVSLPAISQ